MNTTTKRPSPARARLIDAATRLFYEEGIHAVGVDRVIEEAAVSWGVDVTRPSSITKSLPEPVIL